MNSNSTTIAIIGQGRVATHLRLAFSDSADIVPVNSRTLENLPQKADLYIIAVSDNSIGDVAEHLSAMNVDGIVVHTSGSTPDSVLRKALPEKKTGIVYPLQTFSHGVPVDYSEVPFFVVAEDADVREKLKQICGRVSIYVNSADTGLLQTLHTAAVFASNFTNAMIGASNEILEKKGMNFLVMMPLLKETVRKLESVSPPEAQTGPARRNDMNTIEAHRRLLSASNPDLLSVYNAVTDYIISRNNKHSDCHEQH